MGKWTSFLSALGFGASKRTYGVQIADPGSGKLTARAVNADTAMQLSAVFACVRLIAETIAGLPLKFFEAGPGGSLTPVKDHPLLYLLTTKPNRYQTHIEFFETIGYQLALHGNAYNRIDRRSNGEIISLMPHMTPQMQTSLDENGNVYHKYHDGRAEKIFADSEIWHTKLFGNGIIGVSPLGFARNSIGVGISADERVNKMANNGFKQAGVLSIDKILNKEQRKKLRENNNEMYDSAGDEFRVLEAGMKYTPIVANPKDVQFLETRRFQIEDIARFFNVPSVLINDTSATTVWGTGIQQIIQGFYKLGFRPYLERIEASIMIWLLEIEERHKIIPAFDFDMLLRGDEKSRYETYEKAIRSHLLLPNECRAKEGLKPLPGGDEFPILQGAAAGSKGGTSDE